MDLNEILNSYSNPIAIKILKTHAKTPQGINLSDTANLIGEKISTVKDHLKKLSDARLLYKINKRYYLSNFGSYIIDSLNDLEILTKMSAIFGRLKAHSIPSRLLKKLVPFMKGIQIVSNQWQFMNISNRLLKQIESELGKQPIELKILGWNSLALGIEIIRNNFKTISLDGDSLKKLLEELNLTLISDKTILKDLKESKNVELNNIIKKSGIKERFQIIDSIDRFSFSIVRYNKIIHFFLNEKENIGLGPYFLIENDEGAVKIIDKIFNHFATLSKPLSNHL
ncbi:MAG: helix-turn-helix transcriptional regulator [Candidatus Lokiarchaeota archaeon]|nr:helix-turn-helix transcriptional regulator [Candidatus Lokiarchaeota archaeon]